MLSRRDLLGLFALGGAAAVGLHDPKRVYSFPSWSRDWRYLVTDVRHWGAIGDGITDDTAAIQRALDNCGTWLASDGGVFRVTETIQIRTHATIHGVNIRRTNPDPNGPVFDVHDEPGAFLNMTYSYIDAGGCDSGIRIRG